MRAGRRFWGFPAKDSRGGEYPYCLLIGNGESIIWGLFRDYIPLLRTSKYLVLAFGLLLFQYLGSGVYSLVLGRYGYGK